jgi:hypothetical protein
MGRTASPYHSESLWWVLRHWAGHRRLRKETARLRAQFVARVAEREGSDGTS